MNPIEELPYYSESEIIDHLQQAYQSVVYDSLTFLLETLKPGIYCTPSFHGPILRYSEQFRLFAKNQNAHVRIYFYILPERLEPTHYVCFEMSIDLTGTYRVLIPQALVRPIHDRSLYDSAHIFEGKMLNGVWKDAQKLYEEILVAQLEPNLKGSPEPS